jgi:riboflavin kinase/FMN adenylyltransferase
LELGEGARRPLDGVYACRVKLGGKNYTGALHVGPRPTFDGAAPTVEIHILDFPDRDLYGQQLSFEVVERLRDIQKFNSTRDLSAALKVDCEKAAARLA